MLYLDLLVPIYNLNIKFPPSFIFIYIKLTTIGSGGIYWGSGTNKTCPGYNILVDNLFKCKISDGIVFHFKATRSIVSLTSTIYSNVPIGALLLFLALKINIFEDNERDRERERGNR